MYTMKNYQTKKELKEAVARGDRVEVYQPNGDLYGKNGPFNGRVFLEGPHYPQAHVWYAQAEVVNSIIQKVK